MKILLISHGDLAAGMCSTLQNFFGADNVYSACVTQENGTADLMDKAKEDMVLVNELLQAQSDDDDE